jgi:hypothetical protein
MPRGAARARKPRRAPLRYALTVTAPLSVAGRGGRGEGRPGKISTACRASNKGHGRNRNTPESGRSGRRTIHVGQ